MPTIYEYLARHGGFQAYLASAKISGFDMVLKEAGEHTVFVPSDKAFMKLPPQVLDAFLGSPEHLAHLLCFHALAQRFTTFDARVLYPRQLLGGKRFMVIRNALQVNGARVTEPDIECANGVIHILDTVIIPVSKRVRARHDQ